MTPAGYSGTPLIRKLGLQAGQRIAFLHPPPEFDEALGPLPEGLVPRRDLRGAAPFDAIILFAPAQQALASLLPRAQPRLAQQGMLWIAWPKKSSPLFRDLTEDHIRTLALASGLVDVKVCAIDLNWSGLKLVIPLARRK